MTTGTYKPTTNAVATYGEKSASTLQLQNAINAVSPTKIAADSMYGDQTKGAYDSLIKGGYTYANNTFTKAAPTPTPAPNPIPTPTPTNNPTPSNSVSRPVLYGDEPALITARSEDEIQKEKLTQAQEVIGNLNKYYDSLVGEARTLGEGNLRKTNAISTLTGLSGSSEANNAASTTEKATSKDIERVQNERNVAISQVLAKVKTDAVEQARNERLDARQSEQDRISYREKAHASAVENLTALSLGASGASLEGLKATLSPEEYKALIDNAGGEAVASAILFANRPKTTVIGTPQIIGGKMVQAYQTPDGKIKYENIELPEGVVPDNIQSVEKTDAGIFIIKKDGTYTKVGGSAKPGTGPGVNSSTTLSEFPADIQAAAQSIFDGKSKLMNILVLKD